MASKKQPTRKAKAATLPASMESIAQSILILRGQRVLLDSDLAALYDFETKVLLQAVRRNHARFSGGSVMNLLKPQQGITGFIELQERNKP